MTFISTLGFLYGVPSPVPEIDGFTVLAHPDKWLFASRDGRDYYVADKVDSWTLYPERTNPNGQSYIDTEGVLTIPKS